MANALKHQAQGSDNDFDLQEVDHTQTLLKSHNLGFLVDIEPPNWGPTFYDLLHTAYEAVAFASDILEMLYNGTKYSKQINLGECEERNE
jgi:hypothetical protein